MSTKVTIAYNEFHEPGILDYHLYKECFDDEHVYIEIPATCDKCQQPCGSNTVKIPIATWRHMVAGFQDSVYSSEGPWEPELDYPVEGTFWTEEPGPEGVQKLLHYLEGVDDRGRGADLYFYLMGKIQRLVKIGFEPKEHVEVLGPAWQWVLKDCREGQPRGHKVMKAVMFYIGGVDVFNSDAEDWADEFNSNWEE